MLNMTSVFLCLKKEKLKFESFCSTNRKTASGVAINGMTKMRSEVTSVGSKVRNSKLERGNRVCQKRGLGKAPSLASCGNNDVTHLQTAWACARLTSSAGWRSRWTTGCWPLWWSSPPTTERCLGSSGCPSHREERRNTETHRGQTWQMLNNMNISALCCGQMKP